ncbi:MAG TPA: Fic/DOC family N-terminal domain-containing protein [Thermoanaerobaculia bacterium]|nr:Fic/DOC family N-terminal domain-containing protein [Thermoanaerobaculia bacterium]
MDRNRPYNDLPLLPPRAELETKRVLKKAIAARTALAELKGTGHLIPNQRVLIDAIGLQEARLSSEIENVVTTQDELYRAFADEGRATDPQTKEVLGYHEALWFGYEAIKLGNRPLSTRLFEEIVSIIRRIDLRVRAVPGTKLATPNGRVICTPPEGETKIRDLLGNLENFLYPRKDDDLDPLVKLAVMHYQFEAIHPFTDGNGRAGRILNLLFLVERKLLDIPVLYLSRFIIERKSDYYGGLRSVTEKGAWEPWILYMLEAVETMATHTRGKIMAIRELMDHWVGRIKNEAPRIYSKDLVETVFRQPYCKIRFLERDKLATRQTASKYLQKLADLKLLRAVKVGREVYFINDPFLRLLAK